MFWGHVFTPSWCQRGRPSEASARVPWDDFREGLSPSVPSVLGLLGWVATAWEEKGLSSKGVALGCW